MPILHIWVARGPDYPDCFNVLLPMIYCLKFFNHDHKSTCVVAKMWVVYCPPVEPGGKSILVLHVLFPDIKFFGILQSTSKESNCWRFSRTNFQLHRCAYIGSFRSTNVKLLTYQFILILHVSCTWTDHKLHRDANCFGKHEHIVKATTFFVGEIERESVRVTSRVRQLWHCPYCKPHMIFISAIGVGICVVWWTA
jgi:hypothetical protein